MTTNWVSKNINRLRTIKLNQTRFIYVLSIVVGFLSALAAAFLKNAIHYTRILFTI